MIRKITHLVIETLAESGPFFPASDWRAFLERTVPAFLEIWAGCPLRVTDGGCGFNTALILFLATRLIDPDVIVESGTFKGGSSWVFRTACPNAALHCFDLSFDNLVYRDDSIFYHENDWTNDSLNFTVTKNSVCYFDDHVNQGARLVQAAERGFTRLIFDDNVPAHALHRDGIPPVPTIDMLIDDTLSDDEVLEWVSAGHHMRYVHNSEQVASMRKRIKTIKKAPSLQRLTGYRAETDITFVSCVPDD